MLTLLLCRVSDLRMGPIILITTTAYVSMVGFVIFHEDPENQIYELSKKEHGFIYSLDITPYPGTCYCVYLGISFIVQNYFHN